MKSNLLNLILQAQHIYLVGPMPFPMSSLKKVWKKNEGTSLIIYIDGGAKHKKRIEKELAHSPASLIVGDNDSGELPMDILKVGQNCSDLAFALDLINMNGKKILSLKGLGLLGKNGRLDHLLINLGEFDRFLKKSKRKTLIEITLDDCVTLFKKGPLQKVIYGTFSVLTLERQKLSIKGQCRYPLAKSFIDPLSSRGLSNVGEGRILFTCETTAFILQE